MVTLSSYESKVWVDGPSGPELVEVTSWGIGQEMAHHPDCRVREELRRSAATAVPQERRLELARETACTCGRRTAMETAMASPGDVKPNDIRDMRDPVIVGAAHLAKQSNNEGEQNGRATV